MYPYDLIFNIGLYELLAAGGILCAMVAFRYLSEVRGLPVRLHNFIIADTVLTVVGGYFSAVLMQAFYDYRASGVFSLTKNTGATFLGGFIGGLIIFLFIYFIVGRFVFHKGYTGGYFPVVSDIYAVCLPLAHGFGRLGCLMAGCCHGAPAEWGLYHANLGMKVVPVQLFEAIFLFGLSALLFFITKKKTGTGFALYMTLYGVWRFFAEFLRADDRGATIVELLSPSQLVSVIMVIVGLVILLVEKKGKKS